MREPGGSEAVGRGWEGRAWVGGSPGSGGSDGSGRAGWGRTERLAEVEFADISSC